MSSYERLSIVIGNDNINKLKNKKVLLIGLGGVGGSCFDTLIRSGIENIIVCDFDKFEETNLNRQILSNLNNINELKTDVAFNYAKSINPNCNIIKIDRKLDINNVYELPLDIDYIIDACDDIKVKIELVKFAIKNNIKIISSMGVGNKIEPLKLTITDIWKTNNDPVAKKMRNLLRKENINYKLKVVSSSEVPIIKNNIVGSYAPVCNIAGILLANYIINDIIS